MTFEQPILSLAVEVERSAYRVGFNDVPVLRDPLGRPVTVDLLPINRWTDPTWQTLSITLDPLPDQPQLDPQAVGAAFLEISDRRNPETRSRIAGVAAGAVRSLRSPPTPQATRLLSTEGFRSSERGDTIVEAMTLGHRSGGSSSASRRVSVPWRFPDWIWHRGADLRERPDLSQSLTKVYQDLWANLEARNLAGTATILRAKQLEIAQAHYLEFESVDSELASILADTSWRLAPLKLERYQVETWGNGRLASFRSRRGLGPIVFVLGEQGPYHYLEVAVSVIDGVWSIVR